MSETEKVNVEEYRDGQLVSAWEETVTLTPETVDKRTIKQDFRKARTDLVAANQAIQVATTTAQMSAAVKTFAPEVLEAFRVLAQAMKYVDGELAGIED